MGQIRSPVFSKTAYDPFGACHYIGTAQPVGQIHHQEYLIKHRPDPRQPRAFQAVNETYIYQPHGSGDIEHPRSIGNAENPPRKTLAAQKIGIHVLDSLA